MIKLKRIILVIGIIALLLNVSVISSMAIQTTEDNNNRERRVLFGLAGNVNVGYDIFDLSTPISPGEERIVGIGVGYFVTRGLIFGRLFLLLFARRSVEVQLSIEYKPEWCSVTLDKTTFGMSVSKDQQIAYTTMSIYVEEGTPDGLGNIRLKATAQLVTGPLRILSFIKGAEDIINIPFAVMEWP